MSAVDALIAEVKSLLGSQPVSYTSASKTWDVYEGYLFALVVATAGKCGATVVYQDVAGNTVSSLLFRTSPGHLYSAGTPYTHAIVKFQGAPPLEVHVGVRVQGRSGVLHECDVLIVPTAEARLSRAEQIAPRGSQSLLAIECKYYTSHLGINHARNFEGLHADLGADHTLFVSNTGAPNVVKYLNARKRGFEREVAPSNIDQVGYTKAKIRDAFKAYVSKHAPSTLI